MRFFSHEWAALESDNEAAKAVKEYQDLISFFPDEVGARIRAFVNTRSIQEALLDHLNVSVSAQSVELGLIAGDAARGYVSMVLSYVDAYLTESTAADLAVAFRQRGAIVRYDEFDFVSGTGAPTYVHRFLLWPRELHEFAIKFRDFSVKETPLAARQYETYGEPFSTE